MLIYPNRVEKGVSEGRGGEGWVKGVGVKGG